MYINIMGLIGLSALVTVLYLLYKTIKLKDVSILGAVIPRIYIVAASFHYFIKGGYQNLEPIFIAMLLVFISDSLIHLSEIKTKKFKDAVETSMQMDALKKLESKFYLTMENAQVGYYIIDDLGRFEYVNPTFCNITGYSKPELLTMTTYNLVEGDEYIKVEKSIKSKILGEKVLTDVNVTIKHKNGSPVKVRAISYRTENGHPIITGTILTVDGGHEWKQ